MFYGWRPSLLWALPSSTLQPYRPRAAVTQRTHLSKRLERTRRVAMGRRRHAYTNGRGGRTKKYRQYPADRDDRLTLPPTLR